MYNKTALVNDLEKLGYVSKFNIKELEKDFETDFIELHEKVFNTKEIKYTVKMDIICNINEEGLQDAIKINYKKRENRLLNYEI